MKGLLVAGTASEAGKSAVTAGICRWLARHGVKVAPFKAQNMSLNSVVTRDGAEIGRAQAMQAAAAGIEPEAALNPVLLKPGGNGTSQVMVLGEPVAEADALSYPALKPRLADTVRACLTGLAARFDVVVCEGAGSPAEINLREHDLANMGLARAAGLPVIVVADIDRGGALAALYGTLALLSREDQALLAGFVVNKFRGDARLLEPGLDRLALAGRGGLAQPRCRAGAGGRGGGRGPPGRARRAPRGGDPAAPDQQLHRRRPADRRAGGGRPVRHLARRDHRRRPGDPAGQPGHRGRPRLAAGPRPGRGRDRAGRPGRAGARHLRRLPDARPGDPRRGGERRGPRPGAGPAARHGRVRPREGAPAAARNLGRRAGHRVRDPPRRGHRGRRRAVPRRVLRRGGAHLDTGALRNLIDHGAPAGLPFIPPGTPDE